MVPGITAAVACAAYAGIPLTHRDHAQSVRLLTAHCRDGVDTLDWEALAQERQTLAVYMGVAGLERLRERLRRASDRRRVHRGRRTPESVGEATHRAGAMAEALAWAQPQPDPERSEEGRFGDSPIEIREKIHRAEPMTLEQALHELELVGHDFFLFVDVETSAPSVVYRRRGWSYGVIRLDDAGAGADDEVDVA